MKLAVSEYNVLDKIAKNSKMDCWFWLAENVYGDAIVKDLENGSRPMSLRSGVSQMYEGMTDYEDYRMSASEIVTFERLLGKLKIKIDRSMTMRYIEFCSERLLELVNTEEFSGESISEDVEFLAKEIQTIMELFKKGEAK